MRYSIAFLLMFFSSCALYAQEWYSAKVIDAETGAGLPMASVSLNKRKATIANGDGEFAIEARPENAVQVSYVGYRPVSVRADALGRVVRMQRQSVNLDEVVIYPIDVILQNVYRRMREEYTKNKNQRSTYFYRQISQTDTVHNELIEAYVSAKTAVNLRELNVVKGHRGRLTSPDRERPYYTSTNYYMASEIAPLMHQAQFWKKTKMVTPLSAKGSKRFYDSNYDLDMEVLQGENGKTVYVITCTAKPVWASTAKQEDQVSVLPMLEGRLWVDSETFRLLSFKGRLRDALFHAGLSASRRNVEMTLNYTYEHGFAEVSEIFTKMKAQRSGLNVVHYSVLFNVGDSENATSYELIKRTKEEQTLADELYRQQLFEPFL